MKRISVMLDDEICKELKHYAVNQERSITDIVVELIRKELETKKEVGVENI